MFGAWGSATPSLELLQLRALDWDTSGTLPLDHLSYKVLSLNSQLSLSTIQTLATLLPM